MIDIHLEIVRLALSHRVKIDAESIALGDRLAADLGLEPLDIVATVVRLEEIEDVPFPVGCLATVVTVSDLVEVVRAWSLVPPSSMDAETMPAPAESPARTLSGVRPVTAAAVIPFRRRVSG